MIIIRTMYDRKSVFEVIITKREAMQIQEMTPNRSNKVAVVNLQNDCNRRVLLLLHAQQRHG